MATTGDATPVLWLCGAPGVGKTAVGWELYSHLVRSGIEAGYVDLDQLGMCYPEPADDPGRYRMKTRNLDGVVAGHRAAGARCVVVSGVADAHHGVHREELTRTALTLCLLRADEAELTRRLIGREGHDAGVPHVLREAARLDAGAVADVRVDTTGLTVAEAARLVRERLAGWPPPGDPHRRPPAAHAVRSHPAPDGVAPAAPVLWLCGATGVGKSTVGFQVYLRVVGAGLPAAYVDLDQLGVRGPTPGGHRLKAGNLAAVWRTYRTAGARALVMVGPAADGSALDTYAAAVPAASITVCRLHAGRDELTSRILLRGQGRGSWQQPGDPLLGRPVPHLLRVADRAAAEAEALDRAGIGHRIETDGRTVAEITDLVLARTGWPPGSR